jgi:hypothetical protein
MRSTYQVHSGDGHGATIPPRLYPVHIYIEGRRQTESERERKAEREREPSLGLTPFFFDVDRVEELEDEHPEWTTQEQYIHPELIATVALEVKTALLEVIVTQEPAKPLSAMDNEDLEDHYADIIAILSTQDMMVTSSLVALEGLEEKECEEAAGALVGYLDAQP